MKTSFQRPVFLVLAVTLLGVTVDAAFHPTIYKVPTALSSCLPMAFGLPDEDRQLPQKVAVPEETRREKVAVPTTAEQPPEPTKTNNKTNKSMEFLRKIGRVGGAANKNFVNAVGSDEGSTGRQPPSQLGVATGGKKAQAAYRECTASGVVDDMSEAFPTTSSGTEWRGVTDRVMGGQSNGQLMRVPDLEGRPANVLMGHVSLANNGGFVQMVTDLPLDASKLSVDASEYDGIELDVLYRPQASCENNSFNIHLRTPGTFQQASYRYTFTIRQPNVWETIRVPFSSFHAYRVGPDMPATVDLSDLRRIGIVGIGKEMELFLAVAGLRFYNVV